MFLGVPANMPQNIQHRNPLGRIQGFCDDITAEFWDYLIGATERRVLTGLDDEIGHVA
jgi:hypothetical protein